MQSVSGIEIGLLRQSRIFAHLTAGSLMGVDDCGARIERLELAILRRTRSALSDPRLGYPILHHFTGSC